MFIVFSFEPSHHVIVSLHFNKLRRLSDGEVHLQCVAIGPARRMQMEGPRLLTSTLIFLGRLRTGALPVTPHTVPAT